jgi:hypothetical protein
MIDINHEDLQLLGEACHTIPGKPHVSTLIRWAMRGVRGIRLETVIVGGRRFTSVQAIERFLARLNEPHAVQPPALSTRKHRRLSQIDEQLDREGL